ncbi:MAG TPA: glycerol-3-phosphate acyltransferase [Candidatus Limnocylindria bacterium]
MEVTLPALAAAASYLLGSVPSALIAARLAGRPDPRTVGTRNAGSTNVALTVGPAAGIAVLLADLLKGAVCGFTGLAIGGSVVGDACALAAVLGQVYPIFAGFRGGKGAATTLGGYIGVNPALAVIGLASWGLGLLVLRRAVLSTVTAIAALAIVTLVVRQDAIFGVGAAGLTLIAHRNDLAAWRSGKMPTIRESLRDNRRG